MFSYREIPPSPALAPFVKCYWTLTASTETPQSERILPDASFELVFHLGDPFPGQPRAMVVGEVRRPTIVRPSKRADILGVRFHPGGAAPFFRVPASAMRDLLLPLDEVLDPYIEEQLRDTSDRIAAVESLLRRQFVEPAGHSVARVAAALVVRHHGAAPVRSVAAKIGVTERSLERAFESCIGMTPKTYSRLMRFHAYLRGKSDGYFDDSHRIRDFHDFAGVTPSEWQREQNAMNAAFVGNVQD